MSYANGTTHYNLPQTLGTDKRDWFDTNQAFADIDAAIYGAVQNASQAVTDLSALTTRVGTAENDIDTLETAIGTHTSQISAMQTSITQIGNAVTDNKQDVLDMIESTQEASATATYAHAVGSYFIYNDTLYVTTVAIAVGDTIVPNTNCETTDIGTVLAQLNTGLSWKTTWIDPSVAHDYVLRVYYGGFGGMTQIIPAKALQDATTQVTVAFGTQSATVGFSANVIVAKSDGAITLHNATIDGVDVSADVTVTLYCR